MNLALNDAVKNEVSGTYKMYLKENGRRVMIKTPPSHVEEQLKMIPNTTRTAVLVPLDPVTVAKLQQIETFVQSNVVSEKYKPLWLNNAMYVNLSQWCCYTLIKRDGTRASMPPGTFLGRGMYAFDIQVSHVYIGPHKGGETFSLSLHVMEVIYEPEQTLSEILDDIVNTPPPSAPPATPLPPAKTSKPKRGRRRGGFDEIDAPKSLFSV